jgi:hypothetical protein
MDAWPHLNDELWDSAHRGQRDTHSGGSQSSSNCHALRVISLGVASPRFLKLLAIQPTPIERWAQGLLIIGDVGCTGGDVIKHYARCFLKHRESG